MDDVLFAGATGLVGGLSLDRLLVRRDGPVLHVLTRRPTGRVHDRLVEHVAPPGEWADRVAGLSFGAVISCLGTTIRDAGSRAAFRAIDHDLALAVAAAGRAGGARQAIAVSSISANAASRHFYIRTKGEVENRLADMGFDRLDIMRPGMLRGDRAGRLRLGESIGVLISPFTDLLMQGRARRYRSIEADDVAAAMAQLLGKGAPGRFVHDHDAMLSLIYDPDRRTVPNVD